MRKGWLLGSSSAVQLPSDALDEYDEIPVGSLPHSAIEINCKYS